MKTPVSADDVEIDQETVIARIEARLAKIGMSEREASRKAGRSPSYVNEIVTRKNMPSLKGLKDVARGLDCDLAYILGLQESPRRRSPMSGSASLQADGESGTFPVGVPLYAGAWPDREGLFALDETGETIQAPIYDSAGDFAVIVPDASNAPRYRAGELVFATPKRPAAAGAFVVLRLDDGRAIIAEVISITADKVLVKTLAAAEPITFARESVKMIHRITASREP